MEIAFSSSFKRAFKKKIAGKKERENNFWRKIELFKDDPFDPQLKTHKLSGKLKDLWSFTLEYDLRVIFAFADGKKVALVDIGNHKEVY
ncbi:MAG: type II toxin-antitoxin system RelE/ParE family toxin [Pyrinomonadaceae bacterium]